MQRIDGDAAALELAREIDREQDLRKLALAVGALAAVATSEHDVGEVDSLLAERGDVDDAGRRASPDQRQQEIGEQEAGEIVHREA